ncbi:MAG: M23 family metallopeptidase [Dehalococcoidia bacterium]
MIKTLLAMVFVGLVGAWLTDEGDPATAGGGQGELQPANAGGGNETISLAAPWGAGTDWTHTPGSDEHDGLDLYAADFNRTINGGCDNDRHATVLSPAAGVVTRVVKDINDSRGRFVEVRLQPRSYRSYGYVVSFYHLQSIDVWEGRRLDQGMRIGTAGDSGFGINCVHIHMGVKRLGEGLNYPVRMRIEGIDIEGCNGCKIQSENNKYPRLCDFASLPLGDGGSGRCVNLGRGVHDLTDRGFNDRATSLLMPERYGGGWRVELWKNVDPGSNTCYGARLTKNDYTRGVWFLFHDAGGWDNAVSCVRVSWLYSSAG